MKKTPSPEDWPKHAKSDSLHESGIYDGFVVNANLEALLQKSCGISTPIGDKVESHLCVVVPRST